MEIRRYRPSDDIDDVSRVYALSWKFGYRGIVPQDYLDGISCDRWSPFLIKDSDRLWLAVEGEEIVGATTFRGLQEGPLDGWGEIISIYLLPRYFRKGVGTELLKRAIEELSSMGHRRVFLWVLRGNLRARGFYESNGFTCSGDVKVESIGGRNLEEIRYVRSL